MLVYYSNSIISKAVSRMSSLPLVLSLVLPTLGNDLSSSSNVSGQQRLFSVCDSSPAMADSASPLLQKDIAGKGICSSAAASANVHNGECISAASSNDANDELSGKPPEAAAAIKTISATAEMSMSNDEVHLTEDKHGSHNQNQQQPSDVKCKLYLAESTIPNAGLGMYTSIPLQPGEFVGYGDIVIPFIDIEWQNFGYDFSFVWDDYVWSGDAVLVDREAEDTVHAASPGFGAAANSDPAQINLEEMEPMMDTAGLHRSRDPGSGAFTLYHDRSTIASRPIQAGGELFVTYGPGWFKSRSSSIGLVPFVSDYRKADSLLQKYNSWIENLVGHITPEMEHDLWNLVTNFTFQSRVLTALPTSLDEAKEAAGASLIERHQAKSKRTIEWLEDNGKCMDNIRPGLSTIPQAGRGAFATRFIPEGGLVGPAPVIHIPDRSIFYMYRRIKSENGTVVKDESSVAGQQLMLNYCFGHHNSTVLLSPYGSGISFINHNSVSPNAKIQWAENGIGHHKVEWLNLSVTELATKNYTGLVIDVVALRDIEPDEEIFIDYGKEWEEAWMKHVESWKPIPNATSYISASALNDDVDHPIRTEAEQVHNPYPENVELKCRSGFRKFSSHWRNLKSRNVLHKALAQWKGDFADCKVLARYIVDGEIVYDAELILDTENTTKAEGIESLIEVPREAFRFFDLPYSSDVHLPNAFRHEIMIPDHMFPKAWMNK